MDLAKVIHVFDDITKHLKSSPNGTTSRDDLFHRLADARTTIENNIKAVKHRSARETKAENLEKRFVSVSLSLEEAKKRNKSLGLELSKVQSQNNVHERENMTMRTQLKAFKESLEVLKLKLRECERVLSEKMAHIKLIEEAKLKIERRLNSTIEHQTHVQLELKSMQESDLQKSQEFDKLIKCRNDLQKKLDSEQNALIVAEAMKTSLSSKLLESSKFVSSLEKEKSALLKNIEILESNIKTTQIERDSLTASVQSLEKTVSAKSGMIANQKNQLDEYEKQFKVFEDSLRKQNEQNALQEKNKERLSTKCSNLEAQVMRLGEELKTKLNVISELISQQEKAFLEQICLKKKLDSSIGNAMALRQSLKLLTEERDSLKNRIGVCKTEQNKLNRVLKQMKARLEKSDNENKKLIESIVYLERDVAQHKTRSGELLTDLELKHVEYANMNKDIVVKDKTLKSLEKDSQLLLKQKESNVAKMVGLEDGLKDSSLKLADLHKELNNSKSAEISYRYDISKLELRVRRLTTEKMLLQNVVKKLSDQVKQIKLLEKQLDLQRIKRVRVVNELKTPVNIHRWRFTKGRDPEKMELLNKVGLQQRRILNLVDSIGKIQNIKSDHTKLHFKVLHFRNQTLELRRKLGQNQRKCDIRTKRLKTILVEKILSDK